MEDQDFLSGDQLNAVTSIQLCACSDWHYRVIARQEHLQLAVGFLNSPK
jgi:hypothetical protein